MARTAKKTATKRSTTKKASTKKASSKKSSSKKSSTKKTAKKKASKKKTSTKRTIRARRPKRAEKPKPKPQSANGAVDLTQVTSHLRDSMQSRAPISYDRGRQRMRAYLMSEFSCSEMRAEHIVSSLVARGYARFGPHPLYTDNRTVGRWTFHLPQAEA